jgi:peptidyl-prolyl cis-trans isomerase A (cyclophilin A)
MPSDRSFPAGTPAPPDLSEADRLAYNLAQGDPIAQQIASGGEDFSIADAVEGLEGEGTLTVIFNTARGPLVCELFEAQAPDTVANFVGLARGLRPFRDHGSGAWIKRPYYDAIEFHRVIPGFMVQAGDPTGTGRESAGYVIADEFIAGVEHDVPGRLSMANRGPGTGSAQFFITLGPTPHLDGLHSIFGQCDEKGLALAKSIASVPRDDSDHPVTNEPIETVVIERR